MGLIARGLEQRGLPTVMLCNVPEYTAAIKPPRAVVVDFPIGAPVGRPRDADHQREVLRGMFGLLSEFGTPWRMINLPLEYAADGGRDWEEQVKDIYRRNTRTLVSHRADHEERGENIVGREREFAITCAC